MKIYRNFLRAFLSLNIKQIPKILGPLSLVPYKLPDTSVVRQIWPSSVSLVGCGSELTNPGMSVGGGFPWCSLNVAKNMSAAQKPNPFVTELPWG